MAPEIPKRGETFVNCFRERYEKLRISDFPAEEKEVTKASYLSPGFLNKNKEEKEIADFSTPGHEIHGFKNEVKSLKNFLLDRNVYSEFKSLVVVGEYGVGKTALCKIIFNDDDVKSVYAPMIWVSMHSEDEDPVKNSRDAGKKKISVLKRILKDLGVEDKMLKTIHDQAGEESECNGETVEANEASALLYALHLNLRWTKYLIVFDDVRDEDQWDEKLAEDEEDKRMGNYLEDGFPKGSGGRVIYTTRDENQALARKLVSEEHEIHRLWPLSDVHFVWKIYEDAFNENGQRGIPRNDKKCLDELMNKSRGIPLAIRIMATLLPVYRDTEIAPEYGSPIETTDSAKNPSPGKNTSAKPLQDLEG